MTGLEIDPAAIEIARRNAETLGVSVEFLVADVRDPVSTGGGVSPATPS